MKRINRFFPAFVIFTALFSALFSVTAYAKTDYKLYSDFLQQGEFLYKLAKKNDSGEKTAGLTFYDTYGNKRYERKSIGFCLIDLNGDGVKEMIVARRGTNWTLKAMHLYVFTISGGKVKFVKFKGSDDYSIRTTGTKVRFSRKYNALYCPAFVQKSDAYYDDEKETWALYTMKGLKMVRTHYADSRTVKATEGYDEGEITLSYQQGSSTKKLTTIEGEPTPEYTEYCETYFKDLDLKSYKMYTNCAKNRKKLLGKA